MTDYSTQIALDRRRSEEEEEEEKKKMNILQRFKQSISPRQVIYQQQISPQQMQQLRQRQIQQQYSQQPQVVGRFGIPREKQIWNASKTTSNILTASQQPRQIQPQQQNRITLMRGQPPYSQLRWWRT